jgi:vacuolar-type H+-ATPase subunit E/Vma4
MTDEIRQNKAAVAKKIVAEFESAFAKILEKNEKEYSDVFDTFYDYITNELLKLRKQREISQLGFYIYDIVEQVSAEVAADLMENLNKAGVKQC